MHYRAFIEAPYDDLVNTSSRFWNVSGISFSATADGVELTTSSLEALVRGGITFGVPASLEPGGPTEDGAVFRLYANEKAIDQVPYLHHLEYVIEFERSVRGLKSGAPVEYRGIRIGNVVRLLIQELVEGDTGPELAPIPVLVRLEPGLFKLADSKAGEVEMRENIADAVRQGMRATLSTGNLLTGSLLVSLEVYPNAAPAEVGQFLGLPTIPTIPSGLQGLEQKITALLDKLNALPMSEVAVSLRTTLQSADGTLHRLDETIVALNTLVASDDMQKLPASVRASLEELNRTLHSVNNLATTLEAQPNSLIFERRREPDPEPSMGAP